jgi:eukaryotic-like serine/threonine-protein kinase
MTQARTLNNRYELEKKIGDGGMAVVFKATDTMLSRPVAVKVLRDTYASDPQFLERFRREARSAAGLNHPHIVNVYDVGQEGQIYYIVMEFIEGASLKELIVKNGTVPVADAIRLTGEICDGIGYAHEKGLIHRDLKPQNILLTRDGRSKVTDFGIAKQVGDQTLTQAGFTLGTVQYFSPEQAKGQTATPQSDIYSIGIILYEMLTGRIPFEGDNPVAIAIKHIEEAPPVPRRFNPSIPSALEAIVMRAMSKNPAQRYASAAAMKKALQDFASVNEIGGTVAVPTGTAVAVPPRRPQKDEDFFEPTPNNFQPTYQDPAPSPRQPKQPSYQQYNQGQPPINPAHSGNNQAYSEQTRYDPNFAAPPQPPRQNPYTAYPNQRPVNAMPPRPVAPEPPPIEYEEDYIDTPRRSGPGCGVWVAGGLLIAMLVALVVFIVVVLIPNINRPAAATATVLPSPTAAPAAQVTVPNLVTKTQAQAEEEIKRAKLELGETKQKFDEKIEAGKVISQNPGANQKVAAGTKINLEVSSGPDVVDFNTRFANVSQNDVEDALKKLNLKYELVPQASDTVQRGAVVRTDPEGGAGVKIAKSTVVKIYVSSGPVPTATPLPTNTPVPATPTPTRAAPTPTNAPPSVVPNGLIGVDRQRAVKLLEDAGFQVDVVEWDEAEIKRRFPNDQGALDTWRTLKVNQVLGTDPRENTQLARGSKVTVAVKKN